MSRSRLVVLAATAAVTASPMALAQARVGSSNGPGFDTHLFRPAVDSKGLFTVNGADVLSKGGVSFGLVTDYGRNIMRLEPGHGDKALISHSFQGTFGVNYGLFHRLALGLQMPVDLLAGNETSQIGPTGREYDTGKLDGQSIAYVAAHAKLRLMRSDEGIGLAVMVQGGVPTSKQLPKSLGADSKPWFWPQLVVEKQFGKVSPFRIAVNGGYRQSGATERTSFDQLKGGKFESGKAMLTAGLGVSYRALEPLDLVLETYGTRLLDGAGQEALKQSQEVVGGIKLFVEKNSYLMMGGGVRVDKGYMAADQRAFIGFVFEPSTGDRDGDGFRDDEDDCPDDPEDFDGFQDGRGDSPPGKLGCPEPDNDNDGIPDKKDKCPNVPEDRDGDQDDDGCPEADTRDRDHDGILDKDDKCPDDPEDKDGFEDADGCPDPDNDKDGIPDLKDGCPNDPEDKDGFEDTDGCPDPDNDKDRIPDVRDKCPNEPETYNGFKDEDGCPDKGNVVIEGNNIFILEKIQFETGSARIRKESNGILDAVTSTLKGHPEFELLEVQGHADIRGGEQMNLRLTSDRANSVVDALLSRGIERARLRAMGFGFYCPVDPEKTPKAFEKNRRVEFKVLINAGESTGVELGCEEAKRHGVESPPIPAKK
ncbi:MAG: OmpA family protein [Polyangiaceae bacterium]|nr:OmpA family protein [Polyangiaceae bacterium]